MAKSKRKYPKRNNIPKHTTNIKQNKEVYTDDYKQYKEYQMTEKPLILRLFVISVACVVLLSFIIVPLLQ